MADLLRRVGHLSDVVVQDTLPSPSPWAYRTKARWSVDPDGHVAYRRSDSHDTIAVDTCLIIADPLVRVLTRLATPDIAALLQGRVAEITARCAPDADDPAVDRVLLVLHAQPGLPDEDAPATGGDAGAPAPIPTNADIVEQTQSDADAEMWTADVPHPLADLAAALGQACDLWGVSVAPSTVQESAETIWGADHLDTMFAGLHFRLSPLTFFQVNPGAADALLNRVMDDLGPLRGLTVLDVFSGAGAFTLPLARHVAEVFAIEINRDAVGDAHASVAANDLRNVHILNGSAEERLPEIAAGLVDVAVLDPPRSGCSRVVLTELARLALARIVYVSCDPATLARDLAILQELGYRTVRAQPVDLFPQTASIETIAVLEKA